MTRGLAILAAIAVALALLLAVDLSRSGGGVVTHELVPGLEVDGITALAWARAGQPAAGLVRAGSAWSVDGGGAADPDAVDRVLSALRGARWHRRVPRAELATLAPARSTLTVHAGAATAQLAIGPLLPSGDQGWLISGDDALLVDAWVIRALDPEPVALRIRSPLAGIAGRVTFRSGEIALVIDLDRGALVEPVALQLAPEPLAALAGSLAALAITHVPAAAPPSAAGIAITAGARTVRFGEACPDAADEQWIDASTGGGCVPRAETAAIEAQLALLSGAPEAIADARPSALRPAHIVLLAGAALDLAKRPQLAGGDDVDAERVRELLAALTTPGTVEPRPPIAARGTIAIAPGDVQLDVLPGGLVARRGEPVAIRVAPAAYAALTAPASALRDASLWADDPTAITALTIDGTVHARGAVLGEWTGGGDPRKLDALADALAAPRATGSDAPPPAAAPGAHVHHVAVHVSDPVSPPHDRELELETIGARCALRAGGRVAWIAPAACAP